MSPFPLSAFVSFNPLSIVAGIQYQESTTRLRNRKPGRLYTTSSRDCMKFMLAKSSKKTGKN